MTDDGLIPAGSRVALPRTGGVRWLRLERALGDRRLFPIIALEAVVVILAMARNLTFWGDEWAFIVDRRLTLESVLRPHNEHLVALLVVVYRGLVETIGTAAYLPYLAVLLAFHVAAAAGLLVLLGRHLPPAGAIAATTVFLFLGSGFDNLLWAFQMGFVGSVALGLWALVSADRPWSAAILLTLAIAMSSVGLFFVVPVAIVIRRRTWLLLPIGIYLAWLLIIGRDSIPIPAVGPYLAYALTGLGAGFAGVSGLGLGVVEGIGAAVGLVGLVIVIIVIAIRAGRGARPAPIVLAGLAGLIGEYAILALGRAQFGAEQALVSRYIYAAAPFILMLLPGLPRIPRSVWIVVFAIALVANLSAIPRGVAIHEALIRLESPIPMDQRLAPYR
jgi:hypothetical protein